MTDRAALETPDRKFLGERNRARAFFDLAAVAYPLVEWHLAPRYRDALGRLDLPPRLTVLDTATGSGILAAAFADRGHVVTGLDLSERMLRRARKRFPAIDFRAFDLVDLPGIAANSYGIVSCGYLLHGLSVEFRGYVLENMARIAQRHVLVFDYEGDGGLLVRLIERAEGPNYPGFIASSRAAEFAAAGLKVDRVLPCSGFGAAWLCSPRSSRR
jgi:SAM-dependent methyltransferase